MQSLKRMEELGGLHDAYVKSLTVGFIERTLCLELDNFYANFSGFPGDPGKVPGTLIFTGISQVLVNLEPFSNPDEIAWIYDLEITANVQGLDFVIRFSPAGRISGKAANLEILEPFPDNFRESDS